MNRKRLEQIVDTSLTMFREKGFDKTSVMDICNACQITKPTFYKYVNSKEELLRHYYDRRWKPCCRPWMSISRPMTMWR